MSGALQWLKGISHTAQNMVAGRSDDSMEDTEYIKVSVDCLLVSGWWEPGGGEEYFVR